jgi:hypothetical protein
LGEGFSDAPVEMLERISFECMDRAKTLDACLRGPDGQEVLPAPAGIQEPYIQLQAALDLKMCVDSVQRRKFGKELGRGKKPDPPFFPPACAVRMPKPISQEEVVQLIGWKVA